MTPRRTEIQRRHSAMLADEGRLWRDWDDALRHFSAAHERAKRRAERWEARIARAMRGISAEAWWAANARVQAGELWAGANPQAQRVARVVHVTRSEVIALAFRRDEELKTLSAGRDEAQLALRCAARQLVEVFGTPRTAELLVVGREILRTLSSERTLNAGQIDALCRAS